MQKTQGMDGDEKDDVMEMGEGKKTERSRGGVVVEETGDCDDWIRRASGGGSATGHGRG